MADARPNLPAHKRKSFFPGETFRTVFYTLLIALGIRIFAYEPFSIPSGSMEPTLLVGDYVFVSKFSYGYSRYSVPLSPDIFSGRLLARPVRRGDVAVFVHPHSKEDFIKRIVGLPGDQVAMYRGQLVINGQIAPRRRVEDAILRDRLGNLYRIAQFEESLPGGRRYIVREIAGNRGPTDEMRPITIPPGHYFAMGDNRDNSRDSRAWGVFPAENLVGRADFRFFSTNGHARLWQVWRWPWTIRYNRLLTGIR